MLVRHLSHPTQTPRMAKMLLRPAVRFVGQQRVPCIRPNLSLAASKRSALLHSSPSSLLPLYSPFSTLRPSTTPLPSPTSASSVNPPLDFDDVTVSFASKTDAELLRALFVYRICTIRPIVRHAHSLLALSNKLLGRTLTKAILKRTFFGQFVAGENEAEIAPVVERMEQHGLQAILDYAAEADVSAEAGGTGHAASAAQQAANAEKGHEANTDLFASSIEAAGKRTDGFAAIKLTAMANPDLLIEVSSYVLAIKRLYAAMLTGGKVNVREVPHLKVEEEVSVEQFVSGLKANGMNISDDKGRKLFNDILAFSPSPASSASSSASTSSTTSAASSTAAASASKPATVSSTLSYNRFLDYYSPEADHKLPILPTLSPDSLSAYAALTTRALRLATLAKTHRVRLLVDAEQTYLQPAIDCVALAMMAAANGEFPYVYNTYQCYLRDTMSRVLVDMQRSKAEGWKMGAKTVRGAYMWQERQRAVDMSYADPIQRDAAATTNNYHTIVDYFLQRNPQQAHIVVAGHNEATVRWVASRMSDYQLPRRGDSLFFGQLLGMCDHVSYALAANGYRVVKVTPYGPLEEVLPYLIRRAQENADVLDRATKERRLVWTELKRRRLPWLAGGASKAVRQQQQQQVVEESAVLKQQRAEAKA